MTQRFHYTIAQKLQLLQIYEEVQEEEAKVPEYLNGLPGLPRITKRQLENWASQKEQFLLLTPEERLKTYILHAGPPVQYSDLYTFLYSQVKEMRQEGHAINHDMLIKIAMDHDQEVKKLSYTGKRSLIDRFMDAFNLTIRTVTSTRSQLDDPLQRPEEEIVETWKQDIIDTMTKFGIQGNSVFNMDQSGLNYEIVPKRTIEPKGAKRVVVASKGGDKKRATIVSLINAAGKKFTQLVIFRAVFGARVHREVADENDDDSNFCAQEKAWIDRNVLQIWLDDIWWPIARATPGHKILIVDSYPLHTEAQDIFEKYNTIVKFVPKGFTWSLQPLDHLYHKRYKALAKDIFLENQRRELETEENWRDFVIECVKLIHSQIDESVIRASWRMAGLDFPEGERQGNRMLIEEELVIQGNEPILEEDPSMIIEEENLFI